VVVVVMMMMMIYGAWKSEGDETMGSNRVNQVKSNQQTSIGWGEWVNVKWMMYRLL